MAGIDLTSFGYFVPLLTYFVVFIVVYAASKTAKIFTSEFMHLFTSFIIATVFVSAAGPRTYVSSIIPWFAVLLVSFFLILAMTKGFFDFKEWDKAMPKVFGIVLIVFFVVSGVVVFSSYFSPYLPWNSPAGGDPNILVVTDWIFSPRVFGAILLIIITAVISFIIAKPAMDAAKPGKK
ncbi:MAG TPA: hypothetical protein VHA12_00675 [Candidatus Nanoarchaeia archaeon]|nr:hypothetical protein [Candidatus Nanoarchaeia archaeon]